jgi:hypothetical protein
MFLLKNSELDREGDNKQGNVYKEKQSIWQNGINSNNSTTWKANITLKFDLSQILSER